MCPAKQFALTHVVIFVLCACNAENRLVCALRAFFVCRGMPRIKREWLLYCYCSVEKLFLLFCSGLAPPGVKKSRKTRLQRETSENLYQFYTHAALRSIDLCGMIWERQSKNKMIPWRYMEFHRDIIHVYKTRLMHWPRFLYFAKYAANFHCSVKEKKENWLRIL